MNLICSRNTYQEPIIHYLPTLSCYNPNRPILHTYSSQVNKTYNWLSYQVTVSDIDVILLYIILCELVKINDCKSIIKARLTRLCQLIILILNTHIYIYMYARTHTHTVTDLNIPARVCVSGSLVGGLTLGIPIPDNERTIHSVKSTHLILRCVCQNQL